MSSWTEKAKAHFSNSSYEHTPKTPKRGISGVLGACSNPFYEKPKGVSVVLGVSSLEKTENCDLLEPLIQAAMTACDCWGDDDEARDQMRQDCIDTPPQLRADLLDYFQKEYGAKQ